MSKKIEVALENFSIKHFAIVKELFLDSELNGKGLTISQLIRNANSNFYDSCIKDRISNTFATQFLNKLENFNYVTSKRIDMKSVAYSLTPSGNELFNSIQSEALILIRNSYLGDPSYNNKMALLINDTRLNLSLSKVNESVKIAKPLLMNAIVFIANYLTQDDKIKLLRFLAESLDCNDDNLSEADFDDTPIDLE